MVPMFGVVFLKKIYIYIIKIILIIYLIHSLSYYCPAICHLKTLRKVFLCD